MKIKNSIKFLSIVLLLILLPNLIFFISNLAFGPGNNYVFSNNINKNLEKIFKENDLLKLKKGDYFYRLGEYGKALEKYLQVDCNSDVTCFILYHNIGNTYYKLGESLVDGDKINSWQKSLSFYSKALNLKKDIETQKNYDFVLEKLDKLKEEKNKDQEKKEEKQEEKETDLEERPISEADQEDEKIQPKGPSIKIDENSENAKIGLSEDEKKKIENYIDELKEEEKYNIQLNKPQKNRDIFEILQNDFFFEDFDKSENDW